MNTKNESGHIQAALLLGNLNIVALVGHGLILFVSIVAGLWPLAAFNVLSCALYTRLLVLNRRGAYNHVIWWGLVEVTAHAWFATWLLGWDSGFHVYILMLIPLVHFFDEWALRMRILSSLLIGLAYVSLAWIAARFFPGDNRWFISWFQYGNLVAGVTILSILSFLYGNGMTRARRALEAQNARLETLSKYDVLTNLPNRREALALLGREQARVRRSGETFTLGIIDLDHFKRINDDFGHDHGDKVLIRTAEVMRRNLREQDTIARWGGEEFLLILPQTDCRGALATAEKLRDALAADDLQIEDARISITCTIGVSLADEATPLDDVIKDADNALYTGKRSGRNRVVSGDRCPGNV